MTFSAEGASYTILLQPIKGPKSDYTIPRHVTHNLLSRQTYLMFSTILMLILYNKFYLAVKAEA